MRLRNIIKAWFTTKDKSTLNVEPTKKPIITTKTVENHLRDTGYRMFMCKSCGKSFDSLRVSRTDYDYCKRCGCWLCYDCHDSLCSECSSTTKEGL